MAVKAALFFLVLILPCAAGLRVSLDIEDVIDGHLEWFNTTSISPQKYSVSWFNTGSYPCLTRPRIDFFADGIRVYTAWGNRRLMRPGDTFTWNMYSYLAPGRYDYNLTLYHCNEIYTFPPYNINVLNASPTEGGLEITNSFSDDDGVELHIRSDSDLRNVVILPESYPPNWEFGYAVIPEIGAGETRVATVAYTPIEWEGKSVTFIVATEDGSRMLRKPVILRRKAASYEPLVFVVFMFAAVMIYLYFKRPSFLLWKR